jgi:N-acetylglutamate synthase-like GNAT family acetyltransferase
MTDVKIIDVDKDNLDLYPPKCFLNPKNEGYQIKREWLKKRFSEGLKIKILYLIKEKKSIGFIEYVPGELAWRAVDAQGYLFIHCLWISPNKYKNKGYGTMLVEDCIKDAQINGKYGVSVMTSNGPFMAGKDLFIKNGFRSVDQSNLGFELLVKSLRKGPLPKFRDYKKQLEKYHGLNIIFSNQCPWVARSIKELTDITNKKDIELKIHEIKNAKEAQNAPSLYAVFTLVYDGNILVDHYISQTRFRNILKKI